MASKSKTRPPRKKSSPNQLANLGLFDIPDVNMVDIDEDTSDVDESTLESELEALLRGEAPVRRSKPKPKAPAIDIEKLAEECLKDDFDDDGDDDDDDETLDEDLLKELQTLSPSSTMEIEETPELEETRESEETRGPEETDVSPLSKGSVLTLLQERLDLYKEAQKAAKSNNETSKARRYDRAIKSLEGLIKSAKSGAEVNEADIPPVVSIPKPPSSASSAGPPSKPVLNVLETPDDTKIMQSSGDKAKPPIPVSEYNNFSPTLTLLITRQNQYKTAALQAKKAGNKDVAIQYMRTAKSFDAVIEAAKNNEPINLEDIPPPPDSISKTAVMDSQKTEHEQVQNASAFEIAALAAANEDPEPDIFSAPPPPSTVLEALQQRLDKYTETKQTAVSEGNSGKARRLERIIKSYETAIKDYKAGKSVEFNELPTPPGFGPIPLEKAPTESQPKKATTKPSIPATGTNVPNPPVRKPKVQRANTSTAEKQLEFLLERQKLFREAALAAKKEGSIQQAKEYLKMSKGFDSMIEACRCGLPIDASHIPTPPQLESDFVVVNVSDCNENSSSLSQEELYQSLENDLLNQLEICSKNKNHFLRLGDVSSASKFEKLALESKKDLSVIQFQKLRGTGELIPPKFHYETRLFSIVMCNADLSDNELEITIKRGINLPGKVDELDSYVRIDFPIPSEAPQRGKTHTVRDTINPTYDEKFKFEINRKSRSQLRLFKRNSLKLEVWSKGGFLRSDSILGTAQVKLVALESKCTIHESFNLMDGRKTVGGMLEVEIRIRDPLLTKQVEEVREKWLVIGS